MAEASGGRVVELGDATLASLAAALKAPVREVYTASAPGVEERLDRLYDAVNAMAMRTDPTADDDVTSAEAHTNAIIRLHEELRGSRKSLSDIGTLSGASHNLLKDAVNNIKSINEFLRSGSLRVNIASISISAQNDITSALMRSGCCDATKAIGPVGVETSAADSYAKAAEEANKDLAKDIGGAIGDGGDGGFMGGGGKMGPSMLGKASGWLKGMGSLLEKTMYFVDFLADKFNEITKISWNNLLPDLSHINDMSEQIALYTFQTRGSLRDNVELANEWERLSDNAKAAGVTKMEFDRQAMAMAQKGLDIATTQERMQLKELKRQGKTLKADRLEQKIEDRRLKRNMSVTTSALSTAQMLGMEAQTTNSTFNQWYMQLGLSANRMAEMGRHMQSVADKTGVVGDDLAQAMKSADQIARSLKSTGQLDVGAMKGVTEMTTEFQKQGIGELMMPFQQAMTGFKNLMDAPDEIRNSLVRAFRTGGEEVLGAGGGAFGLAQLRQGRGMATAENREIMLKGYERQVREVLKKYEADFQAMGMDIDTSTMDLTRLDTDVMQQVSDLIATAMKAEQDIETGKRADPLTAMEKAALGMQHIPEHLQTALQNWTAMGAGDLARLFEAGEEMLKTPADRIAEISEKIAKMEGIEGTEGRVKDLRRQQQRIRSDQLLTGFETIKEALERTGKDFSDIGGIQKSDLLRKLTETVGGQAADFADPTKIGKFTQDLIQSLTMRAELTGEDLNDLFAEQGTTADAVTKMLKSGQADLMSEAIQMLGQVDQRIGKESREQADPMTELRGDIRNYQTDIMKVLESMEDWLRKGHPFIMQLVSIAGGIAKLGIIVGGIMVALRGLGIAKGLVGRGLGGWGLGGAAAGSAAAARGGGIRGFFSRLNPFAKKAPKNPFSTMTGTMGRAAGGTGAAPKRGLLSRLNPFSRGGSPRAARAPVPRAPAPKGSMLRKGGKVALVALAADWMTGGHGMNWANEKIGGLFGKSPPPPPQPMPEMTPEAVPLATGNFDFRDEDVVPVFVTNWEDCGGTGLKKTSGPPMPPTMQAGMYPPPPEQTDYVGNAMMGYIGYGYLRDARAGMQAAKAARTVDTATDVATGMSRGISTARNVGAATEVAKEGRIARAVAKAKDTGRAIKESRIVTSVVEKTKKVKDAVTTSTAATRTAQAAQRVRDAGAVVKNSTIVQKTLAPFKFVAEKAAAGRASGAQQVGQLASKIPGAARAATFLQGTSKTAGVLRGAGAIAKKLPLLDIVLGAGMGALQAEEAGFTTGGGAAYGALTGSATTGTKDKFFSGMVSRGLGVEQGSNTDELIGAYGSMTRAALVGASVAGPAGAAVGAAIGAGAEVHKVLQQSLNEVEEMKGRLESFDSHYDKQTTAIIDKFTKGIADPEERLKEIERLIEGKKITIGGTRRNLSRERAEREDTINWFGVNPHARALNASIASSERQLGTMNKALARLYSERAAALKEVKFVKMQKDVMALRESATTALSAGPRSASRDALMGHTNAVVEHFNKMMMYKEKMATAKGSEYSRYQKLVASSQAEMQKAMALAQKAEAAVRTEDIALRKQEWASRRTALQEQVDAGGVTAASAQRVLDAMASMEKEKGDSLFEDLKKAMEENAAYSEESARHTLLLTKLQGESNVGQEGLKKALGTVEDRTKAETFFTALTGKDAFAGSDDQVRTVLMRTLQGIDSSQEGEQGRAMFERMVSGSNLLQDPKALEMLSAQMRADLDRMKLGIEHYVDPETKKLLTTEEKTVALEQAVGHVYSGMSVTDIERLITTMEAKLIDESGRIDRARGVELGLFERGQAREAHMEVDGIRTKQLMGEGPVEGSRGVTFVSSAIEQPDILFPDMSPLEAIREYTHILAKDVKSILEIMKSNDPTVQLRKQQQAAFAEAQEIHSKKLIEVKQKVSEDFEKTLQQKIEKDELYKGLDLAGAKKQYEFFKSMDEEGLKSVLSQEMVKKVLTDIESTERKRTESESLVKIVEEEGKRITLQNAVTYVETGAFDPVEIKHARMAGVDDRVREMVPPAKVEEPIEQRTPKIELKPVPTTVKVSTPSKEPTIRRAAFVGTGGEARSFTAPTKFGSTTFTSGGSGTTGASGRSFTAPTKFGSTTFFTGTGGTQTRENTRVLSKESDVQATLNKIQQSRVDDIVERANSSHSAFKSHLQKIARSKQETNELLKDIQWNYDKEKDIYFRGLKRKGENFSDERHQTISGDSLRRAIDTVSKETKSREESVKITELGAFDRKGGITEARMVGVDSIVTKTLGVTEESKAAESINKLSQDLKSEDSRIVVEGMRSLPHIAVSIQNITNTLTPEIQKISEFLIITNQELRDISEKIVGLAEIIATLPKITAAEMSQVIITARVVVEDGKPLNIRMVVPSGTANAPLGPEVYRTPDMLLAEGKGVKERLERAQTEKLRLAAPPDVKLEEKGAFDPKEIKVAREEFVQSFVKQLSAIGITQEDARTLLKQAGGDMEMLRKVINKKAEEIKSKDEVARTTNSLDYDKVASETVENNITKKASVEEERHSSQQDVVKSLKQSFDKIGEHLQSKGVALEKISKEGEPERYRAKGEHFEVELSKEEIEKANSNLERSVETSLSKSLDYERQASEAAEKNIVSSLNKVSNQTKEGSSVADEQTRKSVVAELSRALDYEKRASEASEKNIVTQLNKTSSEQSAHSSSEASKSVVASLTKSLDYERAASDSATGIVAERDVSASTTLDYSDKTSAMVNPMMINRYGIEERLEQQKYGDQPDGGSGALLPSMDSIDQYLTGIQATRLKEMVDYLKSIDSKLDNNPLLGSDIIGAKGGGRKPMPPSGVEMMAMSRPNPSWQMDFIDGQAGEQTTEGSGLFG